MKFLAIILSFFLSSSILLGQGDSTNAYSSENFREVWEVAYGTYLYHKPYQNQLNSFEGFEFSQPIQTVGVSYVNYKRNKRYHDNTLMSYAQIIPQDFQIDSSIVGSLNGFNYGFYFVSNDFTPKSKFTSLLFGAGFNTGRLRLKSEGYRSQKNPFFAPAVFFNPRIFLNCFTVSLRTEYQFDISKKGWRSLNRAKETEKLHLDPFRQSALIVNLCVGLKLN